MRAPLNLPSDLFKRLVEIVAELRQKCPWDRNQTFESLRTGTIEEVHELSQAILARDFENIKEELGDLVLHVVFYAQLAEEQSAFKIDDVLRAICAKLIARHPHVYGGMTLENERAVIENWEKMKQREKEGRSVLAGLPTSLPALIKAERVQKKVAGVGFEFTKVEEVWQKIEEEIEEFKVSLAQKNSEEIEMEFGDLLFSLVNLGRWTKITPDTALERSTQKFIRRFQHMEEKVAAQNKTLDELDLTELESLWQASKKEV